MHTFSSPSGFFCDLFKRIYHSHKLLLVCRGQVIIKGIMPPNTTEKHHLTCNKWCCALQMTGAVWSGDSLSPGLKFWRRPVLQSNTAMIHCVIITNSAGNLLLSKYYNGSTEEEQFLWECRIFELTKDEWTLAKGEKPQVAVDK